MPNIVQIDNFTVANAGAAGREQASGAVTDRAVRSDDLEAAGAEPEFLRAAGFKGELGQTLMFPQGETAVVAVGLGSDALTEPALRKAAAEVYRCASRMESLATSLPVVAADELGSATALAATVEAIMLASYRFDEFKGTSDEPADEPTLQEILLIAPADLTADETDKALARGAAMANAIATARDLVNSPAGSLTPSRLADAAVAAVLATGSADLGQGGNPAENPNGGEITTEVWDKARLEKERCAGLLGVNAGSTEEPRLVRITYTPSTQPAATIYLVGKGITFDTGGLNLKSFEGMQSMKTDMGGAAAVIGAMSAISRLAPNVAVTGICCCTDNQPGPDATKPGDVLRYRNGTTVEVLNTDAEGRLVMADGLVIAAEQSPDLIVDVATLTGACVVALGDKYAGLMSNSDTAADKAMSAARSAGELVWHLPLPDEYRKQLDSQVADLRNIGKGRYGGALTAGLFLQEFVGDNDWLHLDIAGPVTTDSAEGELAKGATGFGVRTLVNLVLGFS